MSVSGIPQKKRDSDGGRGQIIFPLCAGLCLLTLSLLTGCLRLETPPYRQVGEGCEDTSECVPPSACVNQVCSTVSLSSCPTVCAPYGCDASLSACKDTCATDGDCATGNVCREGDCHPSYCTPANAALICQGAACGGGVCETAANCGSYGCATGYTCALGRCYRACSFDSECTGYRCWTAAGECRTTCLDSSECQEEFGYTCLDHFCQPR